MWFAVAIVINLLALIPMLVREYYQFRRYKLNAFEWDDVIRYGISIITGSCINGVLIQYLLESVF